MDNAKNIIQLTYGGSISTWYHNYLPTSDYYSTDTTDYYNWLNPIYDAFMRGVRFELINRANTKKIPEFITDYFGNPYYASVKRSESYQIMGMMLATEANAKIYFSLLTDKQQDALVHIVKQGFSPLSEVKSLFKIPLTVSSGRGYWYQEKLAFPFSLFCRTSRSDKGDNLYVAPGTMLDAIVKIALPEVFENPPVTETLPPESYSSLWTASDTAETIDKLNLAYDASTIGLTSAGTITAATVNKAVKALSLDEFPPYGSYGFFNTLRTRLIVSSFLVYMKENEDEIPSEPAQFIKQIVLNSPKGLRDYINTLLPQIKGLGSKGSAASIFDYAAKKVNGFLKQFHKSGWISGGEIMDFLNYRVFAPEYVPFAMFSRRAVEELRMSWSKDSTHKLDQSISLYYLNKEIAPDLIGKYLLLLASWGVVEVAFGHAFNPANCLDSITAVRLTEFGEYVFDLREDFVLKSDLQFADNFELDDSALIIRMTNESNPLNPFVRSLGSAVGVNRVAVTEASFINGVNNPDELDALMVRFKTRICPERIPENWQRFLSVISEKCSPVIPMSGNVKYGIVRLKPEAAELHRLVATNPFIKAHTLRAEGFHLLYDVLHADELRKVFRQHGYISVI